MGAAYGEITGEYNGVNGEGDNEGLQRESHNEKMRNVTFTVGKWGNGICVTFSILKTDMM